MALLEQMGETLSLPHYYLCPVVPVGVLAMDLSQQVLAAMVGFLVAVMEPIAQALVVVSVEWEGAALSVQRVAAGDQVIMLGVMQSRVTDSVQGAAVAVAVIASPPLEAGVAMACREWF
ncbi:hypothetical protein [Serratia marcescens]|uniref:hypothetical protein n=1 Tax=Serratia marcescens TaxID=615 RepID=UPI003FA74702